MNTVHVYSLFAAALILSTAGVGLGFTWPNAYATFPGENGKIAFVSSRDDGNWNIYSMNPDGSGVMQLTDTEDSESFPSWSPDGSKIAFTRDIPDRGLYVMNADGTEVTRLTGDADRSPSWSPDGSKIVFARLSSGVLNIVVVNSDGSGATTLGGSPSTRNDDPSWSPDGSKIAFVARTGDTGVWVMDSDGTGAAQLTDGGEEPNWSPDGSKIAYSLGGNITVINSDGTGAAQLTDSGLDHYPAWSPDGSKIAFQKTIPGGIQQWVLYIMDADGSGQTKLSADGVFDFFPDFGVLPSPQAQQPLVDYNGDGYSDLAIGVPNEGINGKAESGMVNVIYGSASGLSATAVPDQRFFQDSPDVADVSEVDDHFGEALASGDFNNDGYTDLAVGVPDEDVGPHVDAGAVSVIYGSASGLSATTVPDQIWHQDSANVEGFPDTSEHFGTAVAAGDFNNDGYSDLAIGTPLDYVDSIGGAGSVNVLYGSASGLSATAIPDQIWSQNSPSVEDSVEFGDHFASALAADDFNGDTYADLAVGVPDEDINGQSNAGSVNIIYGSASGLSATSVPDQRFFQDSANIADFSEAGDNFGESLAAGDLNGDDRADLIIGVPNENTSEGGVAVIYGSASGLSATAVLADQFWTQDSANVGDGGASDGAETGELFGTAVAAGDFNDDGYDDLAASAPGDNAGASSATPGVVNIIFGSASGLSATATPDDVIIGNNRLGGVYALSSGDFDGDSFADLAMGQPLHDASAVFFEIHSRGAVTALYGSGSGLGGEQVWTQDTPSVDDVAEDGERFGAAVSTG